MIFKGSEQVQQYGEQYIFGVEKHFFFMMAVLLGWMAILCLPGVAVPVGNYWWDYPVVKGLEYQLFDIDGAWRDRWLPFLLPVLLLRLAHVMSGYGVDYFLAHALIALSTMFFAYHAVYRRISSPWRVIGFWILLLFSIIPVIVDFKYLRSFRDANAVAYSGIYNRYLDIIFCLILVSLAVCLRKGKECGGGRWLVAFWCYALLVALMSKLTYFIVLWGGLWAFAILRREYRALIPCGFSIAIAAVLAMFLPNYFSTNWDIATVRGVSFSPWHLLLLLIAGMALTWLLSRQSERSRAIVFLLMPLATAYGIGIGNNGDLAMLRYASAVAVTLWFLGDYLGGVQVSIDSRIGQRYLRKIKLDNHSMVLGAAALLLFYPVTVLLKTTAVTTFAMASRAVLPSDGFIEYANLPGFFSHELFINKKYRLLHGARERVLPLVRKRRNVRHTPTFFALYAIDLDRAIGQLRGHADSAITWVSFPGLSSQVFGIGRAPAGARPWYLMGNEIDSVVRPDYAAIRASSDFMIVDRCILGMGASEFKELFGLTDFEQREAVFNTVCFRAIKGGA